VIKIPAARIVAAAIFLLGLTVAPLLDNSDPPDVPLGVAIPTSEPRFQIRWQRGTLELSGHTRSQKHEQNLIQLANASFRNNAVVTAFEPLGLVPDYWADLTTQVLYLLVETSSAEASLSVNRLDIRGVIIDDLAWQSRLSAIRNALPQQVAISTDTLLVDDAVDLRTVCTRAFANFDAGQINFEESSTEFRASALPRLERLMALASACENSRVSITGHTDATGSVAWNQRLSLQRANAVGDYLVAGGVDRARLVVSGAGSSNPIADDGTHYGRSLNRRIDIKLGLADPLN